MVKLSYRNGVIALVLAWGVVDTLTTQFMFQVALAERDSNPIVMALVGSGYGSWWAVKVGISAVLASVMLAIYPSIRGESWFPSFKAFVYFSVFWVLAAGPFSHLYVWANNGFPVVLP